MAWNTNQGPNTFTASTGLRQWRAVVNGASVVAYPAAGAPVDGVIVSEGSTGSTDASQVVAVQSYGVVQIEASASTLSKGDLCAASSVGYAVPSSAGDYVIGRVVSGSSGAANRRVSVLLLPIGTT